MMTSLTEYAASRSFGGSWDAWEEQNDRSCKQVNPGAEEDRVGEIMGREGWRITSIWTLVSVSLSIKIS